MLSIHLSSIERINFRKNFDRQESNPGCGVRSANATAVLCRPPKSVWFFPRSTTFRSFRSTTRAFFRPSSGHSPSFAGSSSTSRSRSCTDTRPSPRWRTRSGFHTFLGQSLQPNLKRSRHHERSPYEKSRIINV